MNAALKTAWTARVCAASVAGLAGLLIAQLISAQPLQDDVRERQLRLDKAAESALRSRQQVNAASSENKSALDAAAKKSTTEALTQKDRAALDEATSASKQGGQMPTFSDLPKSPRLDLDPAKIAKQFEALRKPGDEEGDGSESPKEIIVFASLSVPRTSLERIAKEAASIGVPLQFRGLSKGIGPNFYKSVAELDFIRKAGGGADLNPDLFKQYDIRRVPAFVVSANPKSGCSVDTCQSDAAVVYGDVSLLFAMNVIGKRTDAVGEIARRTVKELEQKRSRVATQRLPGGVQ